MKEERLFREAGGEFFIPAAELAQRISGIRAFFFDWDGVFTDGRKGPDHSNGFTEADSMGLNMLRLGWWLRNDGEIPVCGIITGQNNPAARFLAEREHLHAVYSGFTYKEQALEHLMGAYDLEEHEVAFGYDDILDLGVAGRVGAAFAVRRRSSPLFNDHIRKEKLCHYLTGASGTDHAVREICELSLGLTGMMRRCIEVRSKDELTYEKYLLRRQAIEPVFIEAVR